MDREKVIEGLRCIKGDLILCVDCGYSDENGHGTHSCKAFCANDAIALLKEQEAIKPKIDAFGHPYCPKCKILVYETWEFCPHCGQAVK